MKLQSHFSQLEKTRIIKKYRLNLLSSFFTSLSISQYFQRTRSFNASLSLHSCDRCQYLKKTSGSTRLKRPCIKPRARVKSSLQKGGVPATPSGTATLLRLSPNYQFRPRPILAVSDFRRPRLSWLDGRCVQGPGTYSPRHG